MYLDRANWRLFQTLNANIFFKWIGDLAFIARLNYPRLKFKIYLIVENRVNRNLVSGFYSFVPRSRVGATSNFREFAFLFTLRNISVVPSPFPPVSLSLSLSSSPVKYCDRLARTSRMNTSLFFPRYRFELQNNVREQKGRSSQQQQKHCRELREKLVLGRPRGSIAVWFSLCFGRLQRRGWYFSFTGQIGLCVYVGVGVCVPVC